MDCLFNKEMDLIAKRQHVIARLPNIQLLNGGDPISETEREQAERAFIRDFLDSPSSRPERWTELVSVHGMLGGSLVQRVSAHHHCLCEAESVAFQVLVVKNVSRC